MTIEIIFIFFLSYLLGSVPFGLILTKIFLNKDLRKIGSKNIGATNVLRTGNKLIAALTLIFDITKGIIPVLLTKEYFTDLIYLSSLAVFLGHIFCISWIIISLITKYSSLSSIMSALIIFIFSFFNNNFELTSYLFISFVVILYTHRQNIVRIKNKSEDKIKL